jgi:hypothetical protein
MNGISTSARMMALKGSFSLSRIARYSPSANLMTLAMKELGVADDPFVVLQADELARRADLGVGERQPDAQAERVDEEQDQERRRGQHEQQPEEVLVVPE